MQDRPVKPLSQEDIQEMRKGLEFKEDSEVAGSVPTGGTNPDGGQQVKCEECGIIGTFETSEETRGKTTEVTFHVLKMSECGHSMVYGCFDEKAAEALKRVKRLRNRFFKLVKAGDTSGAQRTQKKYEAKIKSVRIRQKDAWVRNRHLIDVKPAPHLTRNNAT